MLRRAGSRVLPLGNFSIRIGRLLLRCNCRPLITTLVLFDLPRFFEREVSCHQTAVVHWWVRGNPVSGVSPSCSCSWRFREYGFWWPWAESWRTLFEPVLVPLVFRAGQLRCQLHVYLCSEFGAAIDRAETY